jgi:CRP/FNR family transcriptional regulator, cyclic AMP receptor protein
LCCSRVNDYRPGPANPDSARQVAVPIQCALVADPKIEHLANVKMFSTLNKRELRHVSRVADVVTVEDGYEIVTEGTSGHEFYLILAGKATVRRGGRKVAELAVIGQREFIGLLDEVPSLARKLLVSMAARLREADTRALSH